jgi:Tubulin domain
MPFENWDTGEELFKDLDKEHDLLDRDLRPFIEECDQMQAIQVMTGVDDAWGGFAAQYMDRMRDEYGKTALWVWGSESGDKVEKVSYLFIQESKIHHLLEVNNTNAQNKQLLRSTNVARSISGIVDQATIYVPLISPPSKQPPYVTIDQKSLWHTEGLLSTALETMTLPSRLKATNSVRSDTLDDIAAALNVNGNQRIAQLQMAIRDPALHFDNKDSAEYAKEDFRIHGRIGDTEDEDEDATAKPAVLDLDMSFAAVSSVSSARRQYVRKSHVFGQVETARGSVQVLRDEEAEQKSRQKQRFSGGPVLQRFVSWRMRACTTDPFHKISSSGTTSQSRTKTYNMNKQILHEPRISTGGDISRDLLETKRGHCERKAADCS